MCLFQQRNGLLVTDGGGIRGVLTTMALHSGRREVVKSGCHTLAILSDIQGQGARIAGADGVKVVVVDSSRLLLQKGYHA